MTNDAGKSDSSVVPGKPPNKAGQPAAEVVEGRGAGQGKSDREQHAPDTEPGQRAKRARPDTTSSKEG